VASRFLCIIHRASRFPRYYTIYIGLQGSPGIIHIIHRGFQVSQVSYTGASRFLRYHTQGLPGSSGIIHRSFQVPQVSYTGASRFLRYHTRGLPGFPGKQGLQGC